MLKKTKKKKQNIFSFNCGRARTQFTISITLQHSYHCHQNHSSWSRGQCTAKL